MKFPDFMKFCFDRGGLAPGSWLGPLSVPSPRIRRNVGVAGRDLIQGSAGGKGRGIVLRGAPDNWWLLALAEPG
jgi:hypothetical protein